MLRAARIGPFITISATVTTLRERCLSIAPNVPLNPRHPLFGTEDDRLARLEDDISGVHRVTTDQEVVKSPELSCNVARTKL
jgi:hypothetical protein